jgi:hypothetical protein
LIDKSAYAHLAGRPDQVGRTRSRMAAEQVRETQPQQQHPHARLAGPRHVLAVTLQPDRSTLGVSGQAGQERSAS